MNIIGMLVFGVLAFQESRLPAIYQSLPTYAPKPKILHSQTGPRPGTPVKDGAPNSFVIKERHPAALRLLIRVPCGARVSKKELIAIAQGKLVKKGSPKTYTYDRIRENRVELWAVISVKHWQRQANLAVKDDKYVMTSNRASQRLSWDAVPLTSLRAARCHDEENLEKQALWNMVFSALIRIDGRIP